MTRANMDRIAIFAHFDADNVVDEYILHYLSGLSKVAKRIIVVSDCLLSESEKSKLSGIADVVCSERHGEYDFGSYKRGIRIAREGGWLQSANELILCNDSCYGPIGGFEDVCERMLQDECDLYGITSSSHGYIQTASGYEPSTSDVHIQSYFMMLSRSLFLSELFLDFMESVQSEPNKSDVVFKYELGFSRAVANAGYRLGSYVGETIKFDDTHGIFKKWRELIFEAHSPLIKYQSFTLYQANIACLSPLYPIKIIRSNLWRRLGPFDYLRAMHPNVFSIFRAPIWILQIVGRMKHV